MTSCPIIGGADFQPPKIYFLRTYNTYIIILSDNGASYYRWLFLPEQRRPPIIGQLLYPTIPCILVDSDSIQSHYPFPRFKVAYMTAIQGVKDRLIFSSQRNLTYVAELTGEISHKMVRLTGPYFQIKVENNVLSKYSLGIF